MNCCCPNRIHDDIFRKEESMKIFIVRHGQTEWNKMHKVCGIAEADLSDEGRKQAVELAIRLKSEQEKNKIEVILVSPLRRARDTAEPI